MDNGSGLFVVFEGIDGSGSSTQANLLYEKLTTKVHAANKVTLTTEPTKGPVGHLIREIMTGRLRTSKIPNHDDRLLAYLFAADRQDHLYNSVDGIVEKLNKGEIVISTRYFLSSLAYHSSVESEYELIKVMNNDFILPDITFYLDCPVGIAVDRLERRSYLEKYENTAKLEEVSVAYNKAISEYKGNINIIDGTLPIDIIQKNILLSLMSLVKGFPDGREIVRISS